jgi:thioesterase domain-containing protein
MFNELLEELKAKEITINFYRGKLQYSGPEKNINEELISKLKEYKPKLIRHFWPKDCPNILPLNTEGNLTPFILLHGGSFFQLSEYLGSNRPLYSFYNIGSEREKTRYKNLEAFAGEYLRQLKTILPDGPYLLGGISMGGHLAFEMAIQLQNQGHEVPFLVLVDSGLSAYSPPVYYRQFYKRFYYRIYSLLREVNQWKTITLKKAKYEIFTSFFDKLPVNKRTAYIVLLYDQLIKKYKPVTVFKGEILLFRASENPFNSEYLGWDKVCKNITIVPYIGNHASMFHDVDTIDLIKNHIGEWLDEIENKRK